MLNFIYFNYFLAMIFVLGCILKHAEPISNPFREKQRIIRVQPSKYLSLYLNQVSSEKFLLSKPKKQIFLIKNNEIN